MHTEISIEMNIKRIVPLLLLCYGEMAWTQTPAAYVNPFIGTSNYGTTQPGPIVPMGMVSMSPYNVIDMPGHRIHTDAGWCSTPYVFENKFTAGFTNVNLSGVGCPDLGSLLIMPTTGELKVDVKEYCSPLKEQKAEAGYYETFLEKYGIRAQMTTTPRTSLSRFVYPAGNSHLLFNIGVGLTNETGGYARIVSEREIEGYKLMGTFCYNEPQSIMPVYFVVRISKPAQIQYWKKQDQLKGTRHEWDHFSGKYKIYTRYAREMAGDEIGVAFNFDTYESEEILVQVGISYVSIANARENLEKEQGENPVFEEIRKNAFDSWNEVLSKVKIEGSEEKNKTVFYTALYHTLIHPNVLQDVNGEYPAMTSGRTVRTEKDRLTMFSGWDVYRINPQLMSLLYPQRQRNMVASLMQMYRESGNLPKFEINSGEYNVMQGDPAIPYIVASYFCGVLDGMNTEDIYMAMRKNAFTEGVKNKIRPDNDFYMEKGYIPFLAPYDNSVSQALEYYIADWSLAQMAKSLGKEDDYQVLMNRVNGYKIYFDPNYNLLRPVLPDGSFMEGFDPEQGKNFAPVHGFHEGTSWNYSFYLPFDMKGMMELHGGPKKFSAHLERTFQDSLFDMANEPDMGYPYYFSYVKGEEWKTQKYVRELLTRYFKDTPGGLPGNDDTGTMSAWCVFAMMGLYPAIPGEASYVITAPVFNRIVIDLDSEFYNHDQLIIEGVDASEKNVYVRKVEIDGKSFSGNIITHAQLIGAKHLKIYCSDKPRR